MEADLLALRAENEKLRSRVAELEQEAAMYRAFFEELPVPAGVHRADGVLIEINRKNREMLGVSSREAVVGLYNMHDDPVATAQGYVEHLHRAVDGERGAFAVMPPTLYDTGRAGFARNDDRQVWTQSSFQAVDVGGVRYSVQVNLDVTERIRAQQATEESQRFLGGIIENAPILVYVKDSRGRYLLVNAATERLMGLPRPEILGKTDRQIFSQGEADDYMDSDRQALGSESIVREDVLMVGGQAHHLVTTKFALRDVEDRPHAVCSISLDISDRKAAEAEAKRLQEEIFRVQEDTLRALSTPLLPIAPGVVVMPLIGHLDTARMQQVLETLLAGIVAHQAAQVILDVTGVPVVDAQVAGALVQTAQAVRLLGAQILLTGIQPAIARTLIDLGADLGDIQTRSTLQSGIAHALSGLERRERRERRERPERRAPASLAGVAGVVRAAGAHLALGAGANSANSANSAKR